MFWLVTQHSHSPNARPTVTKVAKVYIVFGFSSVKLIEYPKSVQNQYNDSLSKQTFFARSIQSSLTRETSDIRAEKFHTDDVVLQKSV